MSRKLILTVLFIGGWFSILLAQQPRSVMLARPFDLNFATNDSSLLPVAGFTTGPFEVLEVRPAGNGTWSLSLVAYDTGVFSLPAEVTGDKEIPIYVTGPAEKELKAYTSPKEPGFTVGEEPLNWWPFLAGAIFLAFIVAWLYKQNRKKSGIPFYNIPDENGLNKLLEVKACWAESSIDSLQLGEGLVQSLNLHFRVPARKTTRQLAGVIKKQYGTMLANPVEDTLKKTDAWRFGKLTATKSEGKIAIEILEALLKKSPSVDPKNPK